MKWQDLNKFNLLEEYKNMSPYEILRVDPAAPAEEITRADKTLLKTYHPDKSDPFLRKTNEEITKLINQAYETIMREKNARR